MANKRVKILGGDAFTAGDYDLDANSAKLVQAGALWGARSYPLVGAEFQLLTEQRAAELSKSVLVGVGVTFLLGGVAGLVAGGLHAAQKTLCFEAKFPSGSFFVGQCRAEVLPLLTIASRVGPTKGKSGSGLPLLLLALCLFGSCLVCTAMSERPDTTSRPQQPTAVSRETEPVLMSPPPPESPPGKAKQVRPRIRKRSRAAAAQEVAPVAEQPATSGPKP